MGSSTHRYDEVARWDDEYELKGVGRLLIRALTPQDRELERQFIEHLSPETLRMRVMGTLKRLTDAQLDQLLHFDWSRELALCAIRRAGEDFVLPDVGTHVPPGDELVAVARFAPAQAPGVAEFAITVADRYQGLGLGAELLRRLRDAAASLGYDTLRGETLAYNDRMLALAARLGFTATPDPDDATLQRLSCPTQVLRRRATPLSFARFGLR